MLHSAGPVTGTAQGGRLENTAGGSCIGVVLGGDAVACCADVTSEGCPGP